MDDPIARSKIIDWFAVLVAVNLQTSFLTPPFGLALFFLKGAAGMRLKMHEIYQGIIPFVMVQVAVPGTLVAWPEIVLWLPRVMLK